MFRGIMFVSVLIATLWSCNSIGDIEYTATADAYLRATKIDTKTKYAPVFLANGSTKTENGVATNNEGKTYQLTNYWNKEKYIRWVPENKDYSESFPASVNYSIKVTSTSNDEKVFTESITLTEVPQDFEILTVTPNKSENSITVTWSKSKADFFTISISETTDSYPLFQSTRFNITTENPTFTIKEDTLKWFANLSEGNTYTLQVHAFNFKANTTDNISGEFLTSKSFTW